MLLNCGAGKDYLKSLGSKKIKPVNLKRDQPWIFIGRTGDEAETPVFWSSDVTRHSLEKSLMLGKIEDRRRSLPQSMRWLDCITDAINMNLGKPGRWWGTGRPGVLQFMGLQKVGQDCDWTELQCLQCTLTLLTGCKVTVRQRIWSSFRDQLPPPNEQWFK